MGCDVWKMRKCCFCIPLRCGLLVWVYFKLILGLAIMFYFGKFLIHLVYISFVHNMISMFSTDITLMAIKFNAILIDNVFNFVFIISAHRKHYKLMRVYYIYLLIGLALLTAIHLLAFVYGLFITNIIIQTYHNDQQLFIRQYIFTVSHFVSHVYLLLLVRSEIRKLAGNYQIRFEKNMTEREYPVLMTYDDKDECPVTNNEALT